VQGPQSFYILRFLLGLAEAGFFPGMVFYLTLWFPQSYRARFTASFAAAIPLSNIIGGPLAGVILGLDGVLAIHGWQWLFLLEAFPAVLLAFAVLKVLPDGPAHASWLTGHERRIIAARLAAENPVDHSELWPALRDPRVLALGLVLCGSSCGLYGITLWLPQIVQGMGFSNIATGFVVALPYVASMAAMILWGRSSDARGERIWHVALPVLLAAAGFALASLTQSDVLTLVALTGVAIGVLAIFGPFFSLPSSFLGGRAAAGGIALVNSIGILGGFLGPFVIGVLKERTGGYTSAMAMLAVVLLIAALMVLLLGRTMTPRPIVMNSAI
jgi:MFS transporter, ACS family, tartrate transporter